MTATRRREFDAIIVGSGATGGCAAKALTEAGLEVLVLEAGNSMDLGVDFPSTPELAESISTGAIVDRALIEPRHLERQRIQARRGEYLEATRRMFIDDIDNPYDTPSDKPFDWIRCRVLGGRTLVWSGLTPRFSDYEFKAATVDGSGEDWPIAHALLSPFYERVERLLGVRGSEECLAEVPDGEFRDALPLTEHELRFKSVVERRWPDRHVIPIRGVDCGLPEWARCLFATPRVWPSFTSVGSTISDAAATGRLELRTRAIASQIVGDERDPGRASGVRFVDRDTHETHEAFGKVIVLCAGTIESTRLLLNSASAAHPDGLGNSSGVLGQYLMDHPSVAARGVLPESVEGFQGSYGILIPRFTNLRGRDAPFLRGYGISGGIGREGRDLFLCAVCEILPRVENRVSVNRLRVDAWGIPVATIECSYSENEMLMIEHAGQTLSEMAGAFGCSVELSPASRPGWFAHEVGTARMGSKPGDSVLNEFCQSWDVGNVYVTDGACFSTSGWQNPTLTMMALTLRACDHIVSQGSW